jgi:hypothetical protein
MLDEVCGVLDCEAFQHGQLLFYREIAFARTGNISSVHIQPSFVPRDRDVWRTFNYVKYKIHGLALIPDPGSRTIPQDGVMNIVREWHTLATRPDCNVIAYKGGCLERDLLAKLNIPSFNLESVSCPAFHRLAYCEKLAYRHLNCGQHRYCSSGADHCPRVETAFYLNWWSDSYLRRLRALNLGDDV